MAVVMRGWWRVVVAMVAGVACAWWWWFCGIKPHVQLIYPRPNSESSAYVIEWQGSAVSGHERQFKKRRLELVCCYKRTARYFCSLCAWWLCGARVTRVRAGVLASGGNLTSSLRKPTKTNE